MRWWPPWVPSWCRAAGRRRRSTSRSTPRCRSPRSWPDPAVLGLLLLAGGAVLLVGGAEVFAEYVVRAARRWGLTALALGVLLAGAEPEEAVTAGIAAARDRPELAVGDAIGANLVVLTLALGMAAVLTTLPVSGRVREYAAGASLAGVLSVAVLYDGEVSRVDGGILVATYSLAVIWVWRREQAPPPIGELSEVADPDRKVGGLRAAPFLVLLGIAAMVVGGWVAVNGAERLVTSAGLDDTGVGLTLLALATSAEMLALVASAARRRIGEVAVAGLVGAVAYNATVSLGVAALVAPLHGVDDGRLLGAAVVGAALPLVVLVLGGGEGRRARVRSRAVGALLVAVYLVGVPLVLT
ncbi:MAG: hypothetical protein GEU93_21775 [Propionibacteriales bacterium]|nr:hypothetical protein [Propionibacteriales bacterium]